MRANPQKRAIRGSPGGGAIVGVAVPPLSTTSPADVTFDTKIAVVVREHLAVWHRETVKRCRPGEMNVVGLALRDDERLVDRITKDARMHP
jgi:hypothetical protein